MVDSHGASPGDLLLAAEAKLAHFQHLFAQYTNGQGGSADDATDPGPARRLPIVSSWRDLPTPSSTPAKPMPATQMLQQQLHRPMRPPSSDGSSPQTAVGGPSHVGSRFTTSTAWPEVGPAIAAAGSHAAAARRRSTAGTHPPPQFDPRPEAFMASSDLALQYRVASATSEELAAKVHVLQQQLALQVGRWRLPPSPQISPSGRCISMHGGIEIIPLNPWIRPLPWQGLMGRPRAHDKASAMSLSQYHHSEHQMSITPRSCPPSQAQSEHRMSSEYHAHVAQLQDRVERQGQQLVELQEANLQAGQAMAQCRAASDAAEQLEGKVREGPLSWRAGEGEEGRQEGFGRAAGR